MSNFYGGPQGKSFEIKKIFSSVVGELAEDLGKGPQSPVGIEDFVFISYGSPNENKNNEDDSYDSLKGKDIKDIGLACNGMLLQKLYITTSNKPAIQNIYGNQIIFYLNNESITKYNGENYPEGYCYILIAQLQGEVPVFDLKETIVLDPNQNPYVEISLGDPADSLTPDITFSLPRAAKFFTSSNDDDYEADYQKKEININKENFNDIRLGDYFIEDKNGFIYLITDVKETSAQGQYFGCFAGIPVLAGTARNPYDSSGNLKAPIEFQTPTIEGGKLIFPYEYTLSSIFSAEASNLAPNEEAKAYVEENPNENPENTERNIHIVFEIPRGAKWFAGELDPNENDFVHLEGVESGDYYLVAKIDTMSENHGNIYQYNGSKYNLMGNLRGNTMTLLNNEEIQITVDSLDEDSIEDMIKQTLDNGGIAEAATATVAVPLRVSASDGSDITVIYYWINKNNNQWILTKMTGSTKIIEEGLQKDWNENDESSLKYIQNRTHYTAIELFLNKTFSYTIPTNAWVIADEEGDISKYGIATSDIAIVNPEFDAYTDFKVVWNNKEYNVTNSSSTENDILLKFNDTQTNNEIWIHIFKQAYLGDYALLVEIVGVESLPIEPITLEIIPCIKTIKQLDEKYIPDYVSKTYVNNFNVIKNWQNNDENSLEYIGNRTHYDEYKIETFTTSWDSYIKPGTDNWGAWGISIDNLVGDYIGGKSIVFPFEVEWNGRIYEVNNCLTQGFSSIEYAQGIQKTISFATEDFSINMYKASDDYYSADLTISEITDNPPEGTSLIFRMKKITKTVPLEERYLPKNAEFNNLLTNGPMTEISGKNSLVAGHGFYALPQNFPNDVNKNHPTDNDIFYISESWKATRFSGMKGSRAESSLVAWGNSSSTIGMGNLAIGSSSIATGGITCAKDIGAFSAGIATESESTQFTLGQLNKPTEGNVAAINMLWDDTPQGDFTSGTALIVGNGSINFLEDGYNSPKEIDYSNAFKVNYDGTANLQSSLSTNETGYAEYYQWAEEDLPGNLDRSGCLITLDGDRIKRASEGDFILGVITNNPAIIGNASDEHWQEKYQKDIYGRRIKETVNGITRFAINDDYDENTAGDPYFNYNNGLVGLVGTFIVLDDGTCQVNNFATAGVEGVATAAQSQTNLRVIKRIDETHIQVIKF